MSRIADETSQLNSWLGIHCDPGHSQGDPIAMPQNHEPRADVKDDHFYTKLAILDLFGAYLCVACFRLRILTLYNAEGSLIWHHV